MGGGVDSGVDSFGLDGVGAGFVSAFGGGSASFRFYGGGEEISLVFFNRLVTCVLRILGEVLVLGSSGSICGP